MAMRILIMVLSYNTPPYDELMRAQQETWGAVGEYDVKTLYYYGGPKESIHHKVVQENHKTVSHEIQFPCADSYYYMAEKFKMALDYVKDWDYEIIFRTNSSSYVNKRQLQRFAATFPKEKLYAGWTIVDSEDHGGLAVSGAGIFLSRDTAEILRENIDPTFEMEEDIYCGRILRKHGITAIDDRGRFDFVGGLQNWLVISATHPYHIRFKTDNRIEDANNMRKVHEHIMANTI